MPKSKARWNIQYVIVRRIPGGEFETVSCAPPGESFTTIKEANDILNLLKKADAELAPGRATTFELWPLAVHEDFGTFSLATGEDGDDGDH